MTSGSTKDTLDRKGKVKFINFFVKKMGAHLLVFLIIYCIFSVIYVFLAKMVVTFIGYL